MLSHIIHPLIHPSIHLAQWASWWVLVHSSVLSTGWPLNTAERQTIHMIQQQCSKKPKSMDGALVAAGSQNSFIHPSIHSSIHSFVYLSIHLSIHSFIYPSIHPSTHVHWLVWVCWFTVFTGQDDPWTEQRDKKPHDTAQLCSRKPKTTHDMMTHDVKSRFWWKQKPCYSNKNFKNKQCFVAFKEETGSICIKYLLLLLLLLRRRLIMQPTRAHCPYNGARVALNATQSLDKPRSQSCSWVALILSCYKSRLI